MKLDYLCIEILVEDLEQYNLSQYTSLFNYFVSLFNYFLSLFSYFIENFSFGIFPSHYFNKKACLSDSFESHFIDFNKKFTTIN